LEISTLLLVVMGLSSLFIVSRMMATKPEFRLMPRISVDDGIELRIGSERYRGIVLIAKDIPEGGGAVGRRLARLLRSTGLSATIVTSLYSVRKDEVLRFLDELMKKAEMAFQATRHVKYKDMLEYARRLYSEISSQHRPYAGGFSVVVWVKEGEDANAEALRSLLEAELGVRLVIKTSANSLLEIIAPPAVVGGARGIPLIPRSSLTPQPGIVIGLSQQDDVLVTLPWPAALERHVAVIGPTGRGKTVLLSGIASQLAMLNRFSGDPGRLILIDPKGDLRELTWRIVDRITILDCLPSVKSPRRMEVPESTNTEHEKRPDTQRCEIDIPKGVTLYDLTGLEEGMRGKAASSLISIALKKAIEESGGTRTVVILDEAWRVGRIEDETFEISIREGRSRGFHVVYAMHDPGDVDPIILDNTGLLVVFGGTTHHYLERGAKLGLGDMMGILQELSVGEAIIMGYLDEPKIVRVMDFRKLLKSS